MSDPLDAFSAADEPDEERFPGDPRVAESRLRARLAAEIEQGRALQQRLAALNEHYPSHYARLNILLTLSRLQDARGGEFPEQMVFVHMPDVILNVRRIGKLDPDALTAGIEVYDNGDIKPGIVWIPIDQIMWAGTTNEPFGRERMTFEQVPQPVVPLVHEQYEQVRRTLAGLEPQPSEEEDEKDETGTETEAETAKEKSEDVRP